MSRFRHVIIGNSGAGINAARAIRDVDTTSQIVMLSCEDCLAYSPVVLPYLVSGKIKESQMYITDKAFYRDLDIDLRLSTTAEGIDPDRQEVRIQGGDPIAYDRLLIATGASARQLNVEVPPEVQEKLFTLRTMADGRRIVAAAGQASRVLIIGAGLVGLETGYALEKMGKQVTIMARSGHLLSRNSDEACARMIQKRIETHGVIFRFGRDVTRFERRGDQLRVQTDHDETFDVDMVVVGKGVNPNVDLAKGTNIDIEWGIKVNMSMETRVPGIFAAGDVAQARHLLTGGSDTFGNWPSACIEGTVAGRNMAGRPQKLAGELSYNMLPVFGQAGAFLERRDDGDKDTDVFLWQDVDQGIYRKVLVKKNKVVGAVMLGDYQDAGVMLHLLKKRIDIGDIKHDLASGRVLWGEAFKRCRKRF